MCIQPELYAIPFFFSIDAEHPFDDCRVLQPPNSERVRPGPVHRHYLAILNGKVVQRIIQRSAIRHTLKTDEVAIIQQDEVPLPPVFYVLAPLVQPPFLDDGRPIEKGGRWPHRAPRTDVGHHLCKKEIASRPTGCERECRVLLAFFISPIFV